MGRREGKKGAKAPVREEPKIGRKAKQKLKEKEQREAAAKRAEDLSWLDTDPRRKKKEARQQQRQDKRILDAARKAENKRIQEEEERSIEKSLKKSGAKFREGNTKKTRADIEAAARKREKDLQERAEQLRLEQQRLHRQVVPEFNPNRIDNDEDLTATGIDAAVEITRMLSGEVTPRELSRQASSAAFDEFREEQFGKMKASNPKLRVRQIDAAIRKVWKDSPQNPDNHT